MKVLVYGNANADISVKAVDGLHPEVDTTFVDTIGLSNGGNAMTCAMVLKKLGVDCTLATWLGDEKDYFSNYLADRMQGAGLDVSLVRRVAGETCGTVIVLISETGSRFFLYKKGVQDQMTLEDSVLERVPEFDVVSVHGTYLMPGFDGAGTEKLLRTAREQGKITLMDVTPDMSGKWMETIRGALPWCDYFAPSILEARGLTGKERVSDMAKVLHAAGAKNVIIKMGAEGVYYRNEQGEGKIGAYPIAAADTTGAGDCFCGGLIASMQYEMSFEERLRFASAVAAIACMHLGAAAGIENSEQVFHFMDIYGMQKTED